MTIFKYRVRDRSGKAIAGTIDAPTLQGAGDRLYQLGYFPMAIEEEKGASSFDLSDLWKRFQKVKLESLLLFSQQLSTLYKAGLPLLTSLSSLKEETEDPKFKLVLKEVCRQIREGNTLYGAMSRHPNAFSTVYVNMVRAGETTGRLGEALDRFISLADREIRTRQKLKEATRYPKLVLFSVVIAFGVLIVFVIPRFAQVFAQFKTPLPLPTRIMIGINTVFQNYWYLILFALFGVPLLIRHYLRTERGRYVWDRLKTQIPLVGPLYLRVGLSRFAYTFVMLNRSGIPILQALEIVSKILDNAILLESIERISRKVKEGSTFAAAMRESGHFTSLVIQMVSVGETSGTLDEMLSRVAESYDLDVENGIKKLSTYIEPMLTLFLGVVVLFLALAVFLPWWNMASLFK
jgi:type II secretory pathway component PulF